MQKEQKAVTGEGNAPRFRVETSGNVTSNTHAIFDNHLDGWYEDPDTSRASWPEEFAKAVCGKLNAEAQRDKLLEWITELRIHISEAVEFMSSSHSLQANIKANAMDCQLRSVLDQTAAIAKAEGSAK